MSKLVEFNNVRRKSRLAYTVLYRKARPIVVTLARNDTLRFKEHGRRATFDLPVDTAFKYAVRLHAFAQAAEKRRRKAAGGVL